MRTSPDQPFTWPDRTGLRFSVRLPRATTFLLQPDRLPGVPDIRTAATPGSRSLARAAPESARAGAGRPTNRVSRPGARAVEAKPGDSHFLPMGTVEEPIGDAQPAAEISVTDSVMLPLPPAVNVIRLVDWPAVIAPLEMLQL